MNIGYTFAATDEHDKKQWINAIQEGMGKCQTVLPVDVPLRGSPMTETDRKKRIVKRSSSSKSDSSDQSTDSQESRRSAEEKQNTKGLFKTRKNSFPRRNSEDPSLRILKSSQSADATGSDVEKAAFRRCKSLTGSPMSALTAAPAMRRRSAVEQVKSDTRFSKPPSGRSEFSPRHYNLRSTSSMSKTPPRSPRLSSTRSTPDLYSYLRRRSIEADRLLSINDQMTITVPEIHRPHARNHNVDLSALMVDSPDHPAASNTSRNFPVVEEDAISPVIKSLSSISATTSPTISVSFPAVFPMVAWMASGERKDPPKSPDSSRSSESLDDVPSVDNDVDVILDKAEYDQGKNAGSGFSHGAMTSSHDVMMTLSDLLKQVCDACDETSSFNDENFITITNDDGTPWHGDDMEVSV